MLRDKETQDKINLLYNGLQKILQDGWRKDLVPLTKYDFDTWFDGDKLGYECGLRCYFGYLYQENFDTQPEQRFEQVYVYPWTLKKIETGGSYHYEIENKNNVISVYSRNKPNAKPFVYPDTLDEGEFKKIGLFCYPPSFEYDGHDKNPMVEIKEWQENWYK